MEELHLINLGLERIPPSIGKLGSLRELLLGRNRLGAQLDALPQELTQVCQGRTGPACLPMAVRPPSRHRLSTIWRAHPAQPFQCTPLICL